MRSINHTPLRRIAWTGTLALYGTALAVAAAPIFAGSSGASVLATCPEPVASARFKITLPDPASETLAVVDASSPDLQRCRTIGLAIDIDRVRWLGVLPQEEARAARRIVLTLREDQQGVISVEAEDPIARATRGPLMPRTQLFPLNNARAFGQSERAKVSLNLLEATLTCAPGNDPAGAVFPLGRPSPGASLGLDIVAKGDAGFHAQAIDSEETATAAGVPLVGTDEHRNARLPAPKAKNISLVISCPAGGGRLQLTRGTFVSTRTADFDAPAAWVWSIPRWREKPEALLAAAQRLGIRMLFITVPIENERVSEPDRLAAFIARARQANIAIVAVEGDPKMIFEDGRAEAMGRVRALALYQATVPPISQLDGVQFDIEPYYLDGFSVDQRAVWQAWAKSLSALADALGDTIDAVVPYWILSSPGGTEALSEIQPRLRRITVMAYRTAPNAIITAAEPVLAWAAEKGTAVTVALESGPLPAERRDTFAPASAGELLVIPLGKVAAVILLDSVVNATNARVFRASHSTRVDLGRVSFNGDIARLTQIVTEISPDLAAWPSMHGLAYHGIAELDPTAVKGPFLNQGDTQ